MQLRFANIIALASLAIASPLGDVIHIHANTIPQGDVSTYGTTICLNKCYWNPPGCLETWVARPNPPFHQSKHLYSNVVII